MATTTSITTTYAGESAGKYISAALLTANTIDKGGVEVKPNIKFKSVIKKLSTDSLVADGTCDFTPTSTITTVERIIQPEEFQVNLQLCKQDFRDDWDAISMGYSAFDVLPKTFQDFLLAHVAEKVASNNETILWQGVTANAGEYNGFTTLLSLDAGLPAAQEVAGAAITATNVVTELGKLVDAIPSRLWGKENLMIYVSQNIAKAYIRSLGGFVATIGAAGTDNKGTQWYNGQELSFDGIKIFVANGMPDNTAIVAEKDNLYFGTGLLNDSQQVKVLDMADLDGSQNVRVIMRFTAAVQYGIVEDIVTYGITNAVN